MYRPRSDEVVGNVTGDRRSAPWRAFRSRLVNAGRRLSLSQRFLIAAVIVVALAMLSLGSWIGLYLQQSILTGVAGTAASSIEALVSQQLLGIEPGTPVTPEQRANLDSAFRIGNAADETRLLQIRILSPAGQLLYESSGGLLRDANGERPSLIGVTAVSARIVDVLVVPVGPIEPLPLTVLEILTPLRQNDGEEAFAFAELYFGANAVIELRDRAQRDVWILVGLFGVLVVGVLYLLVNSASRTIARQRASLAENLSASRQLAAENDKLRVAADELRLTANSANESLLAQVGSHIHDGPIQLLTLIILRLTRLRNAGQGGLEPSIDTATEAMQDLRNLSTGLVLPELTEASLRQTLLLAIQRHENLTGTRVVRQIGKMAAATTTLAVKIAAYRVVQEALTNAFRHGGGVGQRVSAALKDDQLLVTVENDIGERRQAELAQSDARLGLRGMRFRVESLGGKLDVAFGPQRTSVRAILPLGAAPAYSEE